MEQDRLDKPIYLTITVLNMNICLTKPTYSALKLILENACSVHQLQKPVNLSLDFFRTANPAIRSNYFNRSILIVRGPNSTEREQAQRAP
jgi:hypothetical protein